MTDILAKNLKYILEYNPLLCAKVLGVSSFSKSIELAQNENGEHNLVINGLPVHSVNSAEKEAQNMVTTLPHNNLGSIHVIFGLGLGYLCDTFVQSLKGNIIVFEPDIEILRFVLEIVDLSDAFSTKRCFIVSDYDEYGRVFSSIFKYRSKTSLSVLNFYSSQYSSIYNNFKDEVQRQYGLISHNYSFQVNSIYSFLETTLGGLADKFKAQLLSDYSGVLKGKVAVVASAGPSLSKNIETLKKYRENVVIFCVGTALKTLLRNGIIPDFVHVIERANTLVHFDVDCTEKMMLVCAPYTNETTFTKKFKNVFVTASKETEAARWFLDMLSKPLVDFETKGTVAYNALSSAKCLGCDTIILIGQDLAYSDGDCYTKGSVFDDLKCVFDDETQKYKIVLDNFERFRDVYFSHPSFTLEQKNSNTNALINKYSSELVTVDGQNGEKLPTSAVYSLFIEYMKDFGLRYNKDLTLINASVGGAMIQGFENMSLTDALEKYATCKIDQNELNDLFQSKGAFDVDNIVSNLRQEIQYINKVLPLLKDGQELSKVFSKELACRKAYSIAAEKMLDRLSDLYVDITNSYMCKSKLLGMAFMKERSEIAYLMNELDGDVTYGDAMAFSDIFVKYFKNVHSRLIWCADRLSCVVEELSRNESCIAKS